MTFQQYLAFAVIVGMMALFVWGRLRYDVIALLALLVAIAVGIVPHEKAFSGFSDDIVIIVASALLVSGAVARSGVIERAIRYVGRFLTTTSAQVTALSGAVAILSAFVKNIGALAMLMPVAFQLAKRNNTNVSHILMPMSFAALLGGIVTLIGTSPNIIVSRVREEIVGQPFGMFDFAWVGTGIAIAGLAFLVAGWRLLPQDRKGAATMDAAFNLEAYTTEVVIPEDSPLIGRSVQDLREAGEQEVEILLLLRLGLRRHAPSADILLAAGDTLILQGEPDALERVVGLEKLKLARDDKKEREKKEQKQGEAVRNDTNVEKSDEKEPKDTPRDDIGVMEAVITGESQLGGMTAVEARLYDRFGMDLLALSRHGTRVTQQLRAVRLQPGDVIVLRGNLNTMPEALGELRLLPLAQRDLSIGMSNKSYLPMLVLIAAMALVTFHVVPVAVAFFGAAVVILLIRALSLREAYETVEWPILVMLGALIPVSDALRTTGGTDVIAGWLSSAAAQLPAIGALALMIVAAMAVTPFLNNAATVLVVAPIAATFAKNLSLNPDPFLMAVAIGAACDFLTPIGHQCNTLVMGPGGYRFGDYWRLGLPLSIIVAVIGTLLIPVFWPLKAG